MLHAPRPQTNVVFCLDVTWFKLSIKNYTNISLSTYTVNNSLFDAEMNKGKPFEQKEIR